MGDLRLVDQLARLQLNARRSGYRFTLVDPPAALRELIELVGLTAVLVEPRAGARRAGRALGVSRKNVNSAIRPSDSSSTCSAHGS